MKLEEDVLTRSEVKPLHGRVAWVFVFRNFSMSEDDRTAERMEFRFGVSSYPQHILVDPVSLKQIGSTGRTLTSFAAAVNAATRRVRPQRNTRIARALKQSEQRAIQLETDPTVALAKNGLRDSDPAVQIRALEHLSSEEPAFLTKLAPAVLRTPNDIVRYRMLDVLKQHPDDSVIPALQSIIKKPANSRIPNVLRIRAVEALGAVGGKESVPVIAKWASTGEYFNGLTTVSVKALAAMAQRDRTLRAHVAKALLRSFPEANLTKVQEQRYAASLARRVHESLQEVVGEKFDFPAAWDEKTKTALIDQWATAAHKTFRPEATNSRRRAR